MIICCYFSFRNSEFISIFCLHPCHPQVAENITYWFYLWFSGIINLLSFFYLKIWLSSQLTKLRFGVDDWLFRGMFACLFRQSAVPQLITLHPRHELADLTREMGNWVGVSEGNPRRRKYVTGMESRRLWSMTPSLATFCTFLSVRDSNGNPAQNANWRAGRRRANLTSVLEQERNKVK